MPSELDPGGGAFDCFDWHDEWEADAFACELTMGALVESGAQLPFAFLTIDVFLTWLSYVEVAVTILKYGERGFCLIESHPPMVARRDNLRQTF